MSSVPNFKHIGDFPWCRTSATDPFSTFDYVTLTAVGGDEGLAEARRLWWDLESCVFTPTATLTDEDGSVNLSEVFGTQALSPPLLSLSGVIGTSIGSPPSITIRPPRERVCEATRRIMFSDAFYDVQPGIIEQGQIELLLAYVSDEWRLYYRFFFQATKTASSTELTIYNPSTGGATGGTFDLFGYTLNWNLIEIGDVTDIGLSATSGFFTYT
jgi:hypothetical protein